MADTLVSTSAGRYREAMAKLALKRSATAQGTSGKPRPDEEERKRQEDLLESALERFKECDNSDEQDQRAREVEDLKFDRGFTEDQWPADILALRRTAIAPDGTAIPQRPCLVINKLDQPVTQIVNEGKRSRLAIRVRAKPNGTPEGAQLRQSIIRTIEQDSRAHIARFWAFERAVKCGRGYYRVLVEYANDGDFDLDVIVARIQNQGSVYLDPFAKEPDWSDGEYAFITDDMPFDEYRRRFPHSVISDASAEDLQSVSDMMKGWITGSEKPAMRVAEHFWVQHDRRYLIKESGADKPRLLPSGSEKPRKDSRILWREVDVRTVKWCLMSALEILDEEDWLGRYIPIIPVLGKEYNVEGRSSYKGVVSNGKDSQRLYNYARSSQAFRQGLESLAPFLIAEGQDEGLETMWQTANTVAYSSLKYKPTELAGKLVRPPERLDIQSTNLSASLLLAREADADIQATTGRFSPSLGQPDKNRSGRAIGQLQQQGQASTANYIDNLATVAMVHEARILLDLIGKVYNRPGRILRLLGENAKDDREIIVRQKFVPGPGGRPVPTEPGTKGLIAATAAWIRSRGQSAKPEYYDLSEGDYMVTGSVGPSYATLKEANSAFIEGLLKAMPTLAPLIADIYVEQQDEPLAERIKERMQKIDPRLQDDPNGEGIPPAVQQQMGMMQAQVQQLQQALQEAIAELRNDQDKIAAQVRMKQMELESRERIESNKLRATVAGSEADLDSKERIAAMREDGEDARAIAAHHHDRQMKVADMAHEEHAALRDSAMTSPSAATGRPPIEAPRTFEPPDTTI